VLALLLDSQKGKKLGLQTLAALKRRRCFLSIAVSLFIEVSLKQKLQSLDACDAVYCRPLFVMYTWKKTCKILPQGGFCPSVWFSGWYL